jgi:branched-subunit amino acid aminotransferase/4-amino-4-deoxychorismate lyase
MRAIASVNGEIVPLQEARIAALDRGFLFGDSVYEVIRVYRGKPFLLEEHLARLRRSLEAIRLPFSDLDGLRHRCCSSSPGSVFKRRSFIFRLRAALM